MAGIQYTTWRGLERLSKGATELHGAVFTDFRVDQDGHVYCPQLRLPTGLISAGDAVLVLTPKEICNLLCNRRQCPAQAPCAAL